MSVTKLTSKLEVLKKHLGRVSVDSVVYSHIFFQVIL